MPATPFSVILHEWHDLFIVAGTAGATLLGLLFVALSLNADLILSGDRPHLKNLAAQSFQNYMAILLVSFLMLMPTTPARPLGFGLMAAAAINVAFTVYRLFTIAKATDAHLGRVRRFRLLFPTALGYLCLLLGGLDLFQGPSGETLSLVAGAMMLLLVSATATAWDLLVRVVELRHAGKK